MASSRVCMTVGSWCCTIRGWARVRPRADGRTSCRGASCEPSACSTAAVPRRPRRRCSSRCCSTRYLWTSIQVEEAYGEPAWRALGIEHFLLHAELVERLRVYGLSVRTGTINDAELAMRAAGLGVYAITTDRAAAC